MTMESKIEVVSHPLLDVRAFVTIFPSSLGSMNVAALNPWRDGTLEPPLAKSDDLRKQVRDLLRNGKFRPTGRSKPASEYLLQASASGTLPPINLAVDVCNLVSLHSGLPISVVDLSKTHPPLRIDVAEPKSQYEFNRSGQTMDLSDLLCLFDQDGPCANAVKDSQRTKTDSKTRETITVIWGTKESPRQSDAAESWYQDLITQCGCQIFSAHLHCVE